MTLSYNPFERKYSDFASPHASWWERWEFMANVLAQPTALSTQPLTYGVDLSHYNGDPIDFKALYNGGYRYVIFKASEGLTYRDPKFAERWPAAYGEGLRIMAYHFFRSNVGGVAQAQNFLEACDPMLKSVNKHTRLFADVETNDNTTVNARVQRLYDFWQMTEPLAGVYSSPYLWQSLTNNYPLPDGVDGWVAHWTSASSPIIPTGWSKVNTPFWQIGVAGSHAWVPTVPGVPGRCDVNVYFGDEADLDAYLGDQDPPPPSVDYLHVRVHSSEGVYEGIIPRVLA